jgi:hypothetical protein
LGLPLPRLGVFHTDKIGGEIDMPEISPSQRQNPFLHLVQESKGL